jgi:TonB family protein
MAATEQMPADPSSTTPHGLEPAGPEHALARSRRRAYDDGDGSVPHLLVQVQDDLARSRLREAFWISVVAHLVLLILIIASPKFFPTRVNVVPLTTTQLMNDRELTYLDLPHDQQQVARPRTNVMSDKNRVAMSRNPQLNRKDLQKILDSARPGPPGNPGLRAPAPSPAQQPAQMAQQAPPQQQQQPAPAAPPNNTNQVAKLEPPPIATAPANRGAFGAGASPGSLIEQAARAAAASRGSFGGGGTAGDYGLGARSGAKVQGNMEILSDTQGVDFGPYLQRVLHDVRQNWYNIIPEAARPPLLERGKVSIEFAILKDGRVAGMKLIAPSGDVALDRAAWGGITASNPFPPLPSQFGGTYLALRFHFFYNPDKNDLQ